MNTDIGTAYAAETVDHLLTHGRQIARRKADERHLRDHTAKVKAEAERAVGATRWVNRMLPCLPDGNPVCSLVDGNPGVVFFWPGLTLALTPGPAGMSTPFVHVLDAAGAGVLGQPATFQVLPADADGTWVERERDGLAAWIAAQIAAGPRPDPIVAQVPERRRITAGEARFLDAVRQFIVDNTPHTF